MDITVTRLYRCYLGATLASRTHCILVGIEKDKIKGFFEKYSTNEDSILNFIRRGEALGLSDFFEKGEGK